MTEQRSSDRLVQAYNRMAERVQQRMQLLEETEREVIEGWRHSIQHAADRAVELNELTREEAQMVAEYFRRDLEDAGHYLATTRREMSDWLRFDLEYAESRLLDWFRSAADRTRLDMLEFNAQLERAGHYHTGEVAGPGTLRCDGCGKELRFSTSGRIPPCPQCHGTVFSRSTASERDD